jgi:hypothetical protein
VSGAAGGDRRRAEERTGTEREDVCTVDKRRLLVLWRGFYRSILTGERM